MINRIQTMLDLQEQMNTKVDPNWRDANNEWYRAIWVECGEMMDHVGYKWWKKQEIDVAQVHLEIVDVMHFMLAIALLNKRHSVAWIAQQFEYPGLRKSLREDIDTLAFRQLKVENNYACFAELNTIMSHVNMDFNELFKQYCAKNVLNIFRQNNGYKEGTYHKNWLINEGWVEDNEALSELLYAYDGTEDNFMEQIKFDLTKVYNSTKLFYRADKVS